MGLYYCFTPVYNKHVKKLINLRYISDNKWVALSTVFEESVYNRLDQPQVLAELETNGDKSCYELCDVSKL